MDIQRLKQKQSVTNSEILATQALSSSISRDKQLVSALYLAKFGHLNLLGFGNQSGAMQGLADILGCSANSLKGLRDRFDRHVESPRQGWNAPLSNELISALSLYGDYSEEQLRAELPETE